MPRPSVVHDYESQKGSDMVSKVIETQDLTVNYGGHRGIIDVNLYVDKGEVFGFLGPNGAGKTTTLRVLLDVIHPTRGRASIFGLDCQRDGVDIRRRVGYLPGEFSLYPTMKGEDYLNYLASLRGKEVDRRYLHELIDRLNLNPGRKNKEYSHGNRQKMGIVVAFMGKPEVLILDEPTLGLDPLAQKSVMDLVRAAMDDGRTVLFSSHNLPEVQSICSRVGIIRDGVMIKTESIESLTKQQLKRIRLTLKREPPLDAFVIDGVTVVSRGGQNLVLEIRKGLGEVIEAAARYGVADIETLPVTLEEIFLAYYDRVEVGGGHV